MANRPKILAFAGSTRTESYNKKLIRIACAGAEAAGAEVALIDLRDYAMPLYDGDLEASAGIPENAMLLKKLFLDHGGLMLSCPEYNSSMSAVLKNAIDWVSRPVPGGTPLECFKDKVVILMSASPGKLGGLRGLVHIRAVLGNIGCIVLPEQIAINEALNAFDEHGNLHNQQQQQSVEHLGARTAAMVKTLMD